MSIVLVVSPHPDDETLGCGGTILRHKELNDKVHWLIMTRMSQDAHHSKEIIEKRYYKYLYEICNSIDFFMKGFLKSKLVESTIYQNFNKMSLKCTKN